MLFIFPSRLVLEKALYYQIVHDLGGGGMSDEEDDTEWRFD